MRPLGKEPHGLVLDGAVRRRRFPSTRNGQRRNEEDSFSFAPQRFAARREDSQSRSGLQKPLKKAGAGADHVLAVVDDQEELSRREKPAERIGQALARLLAHAEHRGDGLRHEGLVAQWGQIDPPGTVVERPVERPRHLQSEARFAGPPGTHQRQQARPFERVRDVDDFALPAHQARQSRWQIRGRGLADEAVAEAMSGLDESRRVRIVAKGVADLPHADFEHGVGDGRVRPDRRQQLVLRHQAPGARHQMVQHRERFRS